MARRMLKIAVIEREYCEESSEEMRMDGEVESSIERA